MLYWKQSFGLTLILCLFAVGMSHPGSTDNVDQRRCSWQISRPSSSGDMLPMNRRAFLSIDIKSGGTRVQESPRIIDDPARNREAELTIDRYWESFPPHFHLFASQTCTPAPSTQLYFKLATFVVWTGMGSAPHNVVVICICPTSSHGSSKIYVGAPGAGRCWWRIHRYATTVALYDRSQ